VKESMQTEEGMRHMRVKLAIFSFFYCALTIEHIYRQILISYRYIPEPMPEELSFSSLIDEDYSSRRRDKYSLMKVNAVYVSM
jgi:hypothetical protein